VYDIAAIFALLLLGFLVFLVLFERGLDYKVTAPKSPIDTQEYLCLLAALSDAQIHRHSRVTVLTDGSVFYPAMLDAIRAARGCINMEAYIFADGEVSRQFLAALSERARAGVKVKVVIDAIGAFAMPSRAFDELRKAGGDVRWYQPIRWYTFKRLNNRTHRELLIVDGNVGFIGGAGFSDVWCKEVKGEPPWRDTVCRVEGPLVTGLQTTFAENWLEASEEILADEEYFPSRTCAAKEGDDGPGDVAGFVVISAPSAGRSTRARILFQTLLASATKSIHINSPYFMPDRSARAELCRAVKRGVEVKIITPGDHADHLLTRRSSRRRYGDLLRCGAEIHEYQPAMIHAKILIVDGVWSVVGSTNFDNRSFGINDEVNLAAMNGELAARLEAGFVADLSKSRRINYEEWSRRPLRERLVEMFGVLLERQQ
jgi:cardiolipin synthase A/B